jgi:hypothetical protein
MSSIILPLFDPFLGPEKAQIPGQNLGHEIKIFSHF